ncbi:MAG: ATP-dependent Clp protease ATP-binding subunit [Candidatus Hydrogenedentota bacterium]|nr:MAG: ATP-dependent Clp protease ATP-binding subunit [Candidatus Hydrogenedentota bacterium]
MRLPLTERAKRVLELAAAAARSLNWDYIGTEHILLGILREGGGVGIEALKRVGIDPSALLVEVEENLSTGSNVRQEGDLPYSPRARAVLDIAEREARSANQNYIGSEHILLGLVAEEEGGAAQILLSHRIDVEQLRAAVASIMGIPPGGIPAHSPAASAAQGQKRKSRTPATDSFSRDLTDLARKGELDPVIGRESEIERVIQILARRTKNNPVLIGDPGVGKTAVVEGLAQLIVKNQVPDVLKKKRIMTLDLGAIVAGTKYRGEFEERLKRILKEISVVKNIILFIDEVHLLVGAGSAEGSLDAANILKPPLARGEIQCIGATTLEEYRKYVEADSALERRFQMVMVEEPTVDETIDILKGLHERYAAHHGVIYTEEALEACARCSARYISDRFLPDKAIDLLDEAGSVVKLSAVSEDPRIRELQEQLEELSRKKAEAAEAEEYEKCAAIKVDEDKIADEIRALRENQSPEEKPHVTAEDIYEVVARWTGIDVTRLQEDESERLLRMEEEIARRFINQKEAVHVVARAIRRGRTGLKDPKRPTGSFLFLGPTGVGKTELARALAEFLFGDEDSLIRIDMSEFMERHSVSRLIGAPPGYVGYDEGGVLTEAVRRRPYSVVLFDEVEKAHPEVFHTLLQVLDDGRLSDSLGHTVDFRNTVIILTSNSGARDIARGHGVGFSRGDEETTYEEIRAKIMEEVKRIFSPEFLNRLDETIVFRPLTRDDIGAIAVLMVNRLVERLKQDRGIEVVVDDSAIQLVAREGYDPKMGARPLRRVIQKKIEDGLAEELLKRGSIRRILVTAEGDEIRFRELREEPEPEEVGRSN